MSEAKTVHASDTRTAILTASAVRTLDVEREGLGALSAALSGQLAAAFVAAIDLIRSAAGRVIITGMGKSGHIGRKIAATLASTGTPAFFVHASDAGHGDLGMITPGTDVIVALSWSGETPELKNFIDYSRRHRVKLIALTSAQESTLAKAADVPLLLPKVREACPHNLAPTTSALMQLAMGDALAIALLESRGFTASDFGRLHPAGRLGAMLKFTREIMRIGDEIPLVTTGALMSEAIVEMSAKGYGCVGITDPHGMLIGIITDGDLRRHMGPDLLNTAVDEVMTPDPRVIRPDQLASTALEIFNSSKITVAFVTEGLKPVGLLRMHDLLRAGVA
jgi:arabinose-5-phosphate isomerase